MAIQGKAIYNLLMLNLENGSTKQNFTLSYGLFDVLLLESLNIDGFYFKSYMHFLWGFVF